MDSYTTEPPRRSPAEPVTQEQLAFWTEQTARASSKAVQRVRREASVGLAILMVGIGASLIVSQQYNTDARDAVAKSVSVARLALAKSGRVVTVAGCNRDFRTQTTLRNIFMAYRAGLIKDNAAGDLSDSGLARGEAYIAARLASIKLPDCRAAAKAINITPGKEPRQEAPLHP